MVTIMFVEVSVRVEVRAAQIDTTLTREPSPFCFNLHPAMRPDVDLGASFG